MKKTRSLCLKSQSLGIYVRTIVILCAISDLSLQGQVNGKGDLRVVTSFLPIQSHVAAIAGEMATVEQLLDKDSGPHEFQLTPSAVRKLSEADLFVINGAGIEDWLDAIVEQCGNRNLVVVDTSEGIPLIQQPAVVDLRRTRHHDLSRHHKPHDGSNPHIWLDPVIAQRQVAIILKALCDADPDRTKAYEANAQAYTRELTALDEEFREKLSPLSNKNLVSFHEAFPYLAARYNLNYVGSICEFPRRAPSPRQLASLIDEIRTLRVGVLFAEQAYAPALLERIASQTGAVVSKLDTLEVGAGGPEVYLERMRANLRELTVAFSEASRQ